MKVGRRTVVLGTAALAGTGLATVSAFAAPAVAQRRLENRLELWHEYTARTTANLLARVSTTRETSLLEESIVATGSLLFVAPGTLVLRDDSASGSTTIIDASGSRVLNNRPDLPGGSTTPAGNRPAADWLGARLVRLFAPVSAEHLIEGCRALVPKGRGYRLDLLPPRGSAIRRILRSVSITLDPAAGAVTRIVIAEAQGDRITLGLTDHRQNLAPQDLTSVTEPLQQRGIEIAVG